MSGIFEAVHILNLFTKNPELKKIKLSGMKIYDDHDILPDNLEVTINKVSIEDVTEVSDIQLKKMGIEREDLIGLWETFEGILHIVGGLDEEVELEFTREEVIELAPVITKIMHMHSALKK